MITVLEEIATLRANRADEAIHISLIDFGAGVFVDMRLWRASEPTSHGIRLNLNQVPAVVGHLERARVSGRNIVDSRRAAK